MLIKNYVTIGIEWRFGPDWPGQRCGAKTRRGTACQCPANKKNGRCRLHGGASTGAKTTKGRARISAANLRHGKFTKDKLERRISIGKGRKNAYLFTSLDDARDEFVKVNRLTSIRWAEDEELRLQQVS